MSYAIRFLLELIVRFTDDQLCLQNASGPAQQTMVAKHWLNSCKLAATRSGVSLSSPNARPSWLH
jgi:hypothetical protein